MALRRLFTNCVLKRELTHCLHKRSVYTTNIMSQQQMENLGNNPYYSKYADKITKLQKTSPEEFLKRLGTTEKDNKLPSQVEEKDFSFPTRPKNMLGSEPLPIKEKKLESIMKTELLMNNTKEEISTIWQEHHKNKDCISAVIPVDVFNEMKLRFKEFKTFLFPLPRKEGYEFIVVQFSGNEAHFTTLINFQAYKENSPECLTMVHYPELAEDKGIVLMVGEFDKNILSMSEASCLVVQALIYYGGDLEVEGNLKRLKHLIDFKYNTDEFNHFDLIAGLEASRNIPLSQLFLSNVSHSEE
ncbi:ATP synthase mitochondrial F1 complex assembly factor 1 isoform X1 [Lepeophtheirus salmonis]|uniref:ATP synthase mitochondrial F1 complex assembly factor 1 isoform X1 n=1 Tax=Lepeophtheirus salmonis TaxID=72036 RepID=UPI003AF3FC0B